MVIHYEPARLRRNSDQPTAITDVLVTTSPSTSQTSYQTSDIPLGTPTCSARSRHGLWALYQAGTDVVVVHPGGALAGPPAEVARELKPALDRLRLRSNRHDELDRAAVAAIRQFLTDPDFGAHNQDHATRRLPATRATTRPGPATATPRGYWLSGPFNQPGHGDHKAGKLARGTSPSAAPATPNGRAAQRHPAPAAAPRATRSEPAPTASPTTSRLTQPRADPSRRP